MGPRICLPSQNAFRPGEEGRRLFDWEESGVCHQGQRFSIALNASWCKTLSSIQRLFITVALCLLPLCPRSRSAVPLPLEAQAHWSCSHLGRSCSTMLRCCSVQILKNTRHHKGSNSWFLSKENISPATVMLSQGAGGRSKLYVFPRW